MGIGTVRVHWHLGHYDGTGMAVAVAGRAGQTGCAKSGDLDVHNIMGPGRKERCEGSQRRWSVTTFTTVLLLLPPRSSPALATWGAVTNLGWERPKASTCDKRGPTTGHLDDAALACGLSLGSWVGCSRVRGPNNRRGQESRVSVLQMSCMNHH